MVTFKLVACCKFLFVPNNNLSKIFPIFQDVETDYFQDAKFVHCLINSEPATIIMYIHTVISPPILSLFWAIFAMQAIAQQFI